MTFPPLRARPIWIPAIAVVITASLLAFNILPIVFLGLPSTVASSWLPSEYLPILLALVMANAFAPRFTLWERLGTRRAAWQAFICALLVISVPTVLSIVLPTPISTTRINPIVVASNVAIVAALASLCVGILGKLSGSLAFATVLWAMTQLPPSYPDILWLSPRTFITATNGVHADIHWYWIIPLITAALTWAYARRSLPIVGKSQ